MNVISLCRFVGGRKALALAINRDRHTIDMWYENGIPLSGAHALSHAIRARGEEMLEASKRIDKAVIDARLRQDKKIMDF